MRINRKPGNDAPVNFTFWTYNSATPKPQPYGEYALAGGEYGAAERSLPAGRLPGDCGAEIVKNVFLRLEILMLDK